MLNRERSAAGLALALAIASVVFGLLPTAFSMMPGQEQGRPNALFRVLVDANPFGILPAFALLFGPGVLAGVAIAAAVKVFSRKDISWRTPKQLALGSCLICGITLILSGWNLLLFLMAMGH